MQAFGYNGEAQVSRCGIGGVPGAGPAWRRTEHLLRS